MSFNKLQKHIKNIRKFSSSIEEINVSWLKYFLLILLLIIIAWFNLIFFDLKNITQLTPLTYLLCVFFLAYFSLQQKEIFDFNKNELKDLSAIKTDKKENPKRVTENRLNELNDKSRLLINFEKVYLDNNLSLPKLANDMNASCNETSFLINELYRDNFYNFINKYRIEEAKRLLLSEKYNQLNILGKRIILRTNFTK